MSIAEGSAALRFHQAIRSETTLQAHELLRDVVAALTVLANALLHESVAPARIVDLLHAEAQLGDLALHLFSHPITLCFLPLAAAQLDGLTALT